MFRLVFFLIMCCCTLAAQAQLTVRQYKIKKSGGQLFLGQGRMDKEGNLIYGGYGTDSGTGSGGMYVTKMDRSGNPIWSRQTGFYGLASATALADGTYQAICDGPFPYVTRFGHDGRVLNGAQYNFQSAIAPAGVATAITPGGRLIVVGNYRTHQGDFDIYGNPYMGWIVCADSAGMFINWYQQLAIERLQSAVVIKDVATIGNYIYVGGSSTLGGFGYSYRKSMLLKLDTSGNLVSRHVYEGGMTSGNDTFYAHGIERLQVLNGQLYANIKAQKWNENFGDTLRDQEVQIVGSIDTGSGLLTGTMIRLPGYHYLNHTCMYVTGPSQAFTAQSPSQTYTGKPVVSMSKIVANNVLYSQRLEGDSAKEATDIFAVNDSVTIIGNTPSYNGQTGYLANIFPGSPDTNAHCPVSGIPVVTTPVTRTPSVLSEVTPFYYVMDMFNFVNWGADSTYRKPHCVPELWPPTGVPAIAGNNTLALYPNPGHQTVYIRKGRSAVKHITMRDMAGRDIPLDRPADEGDRYRLTLPESLHGIYFFTIQGDQEVTTLKWLAE